MRISFLTLLIRQSVDRIDPVFAVLVLRISGPAFDTDQLTILEVVHWTGFDQIDAAAVLVFFIHGRITNAPDVATMEVDQFALHPAIVGSMSEARLSRDVRIRAAMSRFLFAAGH